MDEKKASNKASPQVQSNNTTPITPNNPRHKRALAALSRGDVMRQDMDGIVGATNSPQYISELRDCGWNIVTERVPMRDRDGRVTRPGRYYLANGQHALAAKAGG